MRRKMHAAAILLAIASQVQAQSSSDSVGTEGASPFAATPSLAQPAEVQDGAEFGDAAATQFVKNQNHTAPIAHLDKPQQSNSQLAGYMSCNDWSPNLWNGYACERASLAARISQHVDMQCKCFDHQSHLHARASGACSSGCSSGNCDVGKGAKVVNRYRQTMSTLHAAASDSCSVPSGCASPCNSGSGSDPCNRAIPSHPSSAMRPLTPIIANPPRNRVATPAMDSQGAFSILNAQPSNLTLR